METKQHTLNLKVDIPLLTDRELNNAITGITRLKFDYEIKFPDWENRYKEVLDCAILQHLKETFIKNL